MKKLMRGFRSGQKGFTLLELLIVVAILGILAAILVPNLVAFLGSGQAAAANTEVANVETAALAYYADHSSGNSTGWPPNTNLALGLLDLGYLDKAATVDYHFNSFGKVDAPPADDQAWPNDSNITWDSASHKWMKQ